MVEIAQYAFKSETLDELKENYHYLNYPVIYLLLNDKTAYIGETTSILKRTKAHLKDKRRKGLTRMYIISSELFNQSATYNLETNLINFFIAENIYKLQNTSQIRINITHDYYEKFFYNNQLFGEIWNELYEKKIVNAKRRDLINSDIYKLSPFTELSNQQDDIQEKIIEYCENNIKSIQKSTYIIEGEAGTGKSVLISALYNEIQNRSVDKSSNLFETENYILINHNEMIKTYQKIAKSLPLIKAKNILKPTSFINNVIKSDIVIIDEGHLLLSRADPYNNFRGDNQLREIIKKAKVVILMFDFKQFLKAKSYWSFERLTEQLVGTKIQKYRLIDQFRMKTNTEINYWLNSFVEKKVLPLPRTYEKFDFRVFDNINLMYNEIKKKNSEVGLSRIVSTFDFEHKKDGKDYFVEIADLKLPWNRNYKKSWAEIENTINEVGSIYTIQGFDLNYVGVIIGESIQYDYEKNELKINSEYYKDKEAFKFVNELENPELVKETIILNSLNVLLKRGIKGVYIYACNNKLRRKLTTSS